MPRFPRLRPRPRPAKPTSGHADTPVASAPGTVRIPEAALADIRATEALIDQHTRLVRALERELALLVSSSCNVNLETEHWELDSRHGLIERRDPSPIPAQ